MRVSFSAGQKLGLLLAVGVVGCSTSTSGTGAGSASLLPDDAPDWVAQGSGAFNDGERSFYGVGAQSGVTNVNLARQGAAAQARNDLALSLDTYIRSLLKSYQANVGDLTVGSTSEEQVVEQAVRQYSEASLTGVKIINYWADDDSHTLYALAVLDFEAAEDQLNKIEQLSRQAREYIRGNAERLFDELAREGQHRR